MTQASPASPTSRPADGRVVTSLLGAGGDALVDDFEDALALGSGQGEARRAGPFLAQPDFLHGQLDVLDELRVGIEVEQRRELPGLAA